LEAWYRKAERARDKRRETREPMGAGKGWRAKEKERDRDTTGGLLLK
jgi:hypothetical protein